MPAKLLGPGSVPGLGLCHVAIASNGAGSEANTFACVALLT